MENVKERSTVLITGCSSGFGAASAIYFAGKGWNVIATMRNPQPIPSLEGNAHVLISKLDVQDTSTISSAIEEGIARFGKIDVLINNAGFGMNGLFEAIPAEKALEQFEVNVFGVMNTTRAILPHFRSRSKGLIINVSSGVGVFGLPLASLYSSSKFAVEGFSEAVSYELASVGVTVKIVEPGAAPETGFPKRSIDENAGNVPPAEYSRMITTMGGIFEKFSHAADKNATDKVVRGIYEAATDNSKQLRYVLTDDIKPLVKARRETSEDEYISSLRGIFLYNELLPAVSE